MSLYDTFFRYPKNFPLPMVLDGPLGTQLIKRGMPQGVGTSDYVMANPDMLREIQKNYVDAGADMILTATFDGNRPTLERHGFKGDVGNLVKELSALSVGTAKVIAASMSPTGLFIEPVGDTPFDEVAAIYAEAADAMKDNVDVFFIETMINLNEVRAAVMGVKSVTDKPVFTSLTVNEYGRTMSGDSLIPAIITLSDLGINAFGCNCSLGPDSIFNALKPVIPYSVSLGIPLIAKPNAGIPHTDEGCDSFCVHSDDYSSFARGALDSGIMLLGGCCGSDESCIAAIRNQVNAGCAFDGISCGLPSTENLCCNNHTAAEFDPDVEAIDVTEDISDDFDDCKDDVPLLRVTAESLEYLNEAYFTFDRPFALCGEREAYEKFSRYYCGRALFVEE